MSGHPPATTRIPCSRQNWTAWSLTAPLPAARYIQMRPMPASAQSLTTASGSSGEVMRSAASTGGSMSRTRAKQRRPWILGVLGFTGTTSSAVRKFFEKLDNEAPGFPRDPDSNPSLGQEILNGVQREILSE